MGSQKKKKQQHDPIIKFSKNHNTNRADMRSKFYEQIDKSYYKRHEQSQCRYVKREIANILEYLLETNLEQFHFSAVSPFSLPPSRPTVPGIYLNLLKAFFLCHPSYYNSTIIPHYYFTHTHTTIFWIMQKEKKKAHKPHVHDNHTARKLFGASVKNASGNCS